MKVKLFIDEDVHADLSQALRLRGYNVVHAQELERKGNSDSSQLVFAVDQERCLFTFNVRDFVILHNQYMQSRKDHWGIIVAKQAPLRPTFRKLLQFLQRQSQKALKNRLVFFTLRNPGISCGQSVTEQV